ncbi:MAG: hypothetical protein F6K53_20155 [Moorea sp. SIO4A1]|uniref:hypothetical protein n=1 Tax=Moorena sp. SIO4A1 TaxID=2607835 RepID=UPI0014186FF1|nr:hypothetical protein [Moorena sp. SIO4A1]NEO43285.1 hypothetical protein [Moorena sp. SIO4A3]NEQ59585.1 hypothetical protein [Moorena sp. SIO4A1]
MNPILVNPIKEELHARSISFHGLLSSVGLFGEVLRPKQRFYVKTLKAQVYIAALGRKSEEIAKDWGVDPDTLEFYLDQASLDRLTAIFFAAYRQVKIYKTPVQLAVEAALDFSKLVGQKSCTSPVKCQRLRGDD